MADQPKSWQFLGPFGSDVYERIHNQAKLVKSSGGKGDLNNSMYASKYGVRSRFPRSSPKYVRYNGVRHHEFLETTARMYIRVNNPKAFVNDVGTDQHLRAIANVLVGNQKVDKDGLITNASPVGGNGYIDFFLQQAVHSINEKMQVIETLSDNYVAFFFGQSAPIFQYSGMLMNTYQDDWMINMLRMFQSIGRGSQLARRGVLFYLKYDSLIISGSLLNLNFTLTGDTEIVVPFGFNFLVRKIHIIYGGLEPATDFTLDTTIDILNSQSFFPQGTAPNESGRAALQGKINDNLESDSTYGASTTNAISSASLNKPATAEGAPVDIKADGDPSEETWDDVQGWSEGSA
jgi:hypothetical protein